MNVNGEQLRAITTDACDVLVFAGAGSGKTTVLTGRILHLLEHGAAPESLLVLTFTRYAANEMRKRLERELGERWPAVRGRMLIGTFHAVALQILRDGGHLLGYDPQALTVLEPDDSDLLLEWVAVDLGYLIQQRGKPKWKHGLSLAMLEQSLDAYYTGQPLKDRKNTSRPATIGKYEILREYKTRLRHMNALDFGSILTECRRLLKNHAEFRHQWDMRIRHVLVDELQDTDATQYDLHDFFSPPATFFGVGDFRQSIYGWRGARPDLIRERHPDAEQFELVQCHRCGSEIVDAANALIRASGEELPDLECATGLGGEVSPVTGRSAAVIHDLFELSAKDGFRWKDIAILSRNHAGLKRIADLLDDAALAGVDPIPYHRVGTGLEVCHSPAFLQIFAALRLVVNPRDNLAFARIAEILPCSHQQLTAILATMQPSHLDVYLASNPSSWFAEFLRGSYRLDECTETIGTLLSTGRIANPKASFDWMYPRLCGLTVRDAVEWLSLRDMQDDLPEADQDAVTLSTVHAAKGLEWPAVIALNLNEGTFPTNRSAADPDSLAEERRVAYVMLTRAREVFLAHYRGPEDQAEGRGAREPSRFLYEAGILSRADQ